MATLMVLCRFLFFFQNVVETKLVLWVVTVLHNFTFGALCVQDTHLQFPPFSQCPLEYLGLRRKLTKIKIVGWFHVPS